MRGGAYLPDGWVHDAVVLIRHSGLVAGLPISEFVVVQPVVWPGDSDIVVSFGDPSSSHQRPALSHRDSTNENGNAASAD